MKQKEFDWDKYLSDSKYKEVRNSSPDLSSRRPPTMYSPDRKWIYLSSQDIDFETNDLNGLKSILEALSSSYNLTREMHKSDYLKLYLIRIDFIEVCRLIANLVDNPEDYNDPDSLLDSLP